MAIMELPIVGGESYEVELLFDSTCPSHDVPKGFLMQVNQSVNKKGSSGKPISEMKVLEGSKRHFFPSYFVRRTISP